MKPFLTLLATSWIIASAAAQYTVTGMEAYPAPVHLVMTDASSDLLNARGRLITELSRNGFNVISEQQRSTMINNESTAARTAEVLAAFGPEGASEEELRAQLDLKGINWIYGAKPQIDAFLASGKVRTWVVETQRNQYFTKKEDHYAWAEGAELPKITLDAPNTFHYLSFNYTYRESLTCGNTFSEIHGSINEVSGNSNVHRVSFDFKQPMLGSACPSAIITELAKRMKPNPALQPKEADIDVQVKAGSEGLASIGTLMIVPQPGKDCAGVTSADAIDMFALELITHFDIVDRSAQNLIFQEQQLAMTGLIREADLVEAGLSAGAQGILTVQGSCLANQALWKAKLISVETSVLVLSAIGKEATPQEVAEAISKAL